MQLKIRTGIFAFFISLSMVVYWPAPVIASLFFSEVTTYYVATAWGHWVLFLLKIIVGIDYRVHGSENIPDKPCVVLSKHQSAVDIFIFLPIFKPQTWVMKRELLRIPCFGWVMRATRPIAIDRSAGRSALKFMVERGIEKLQKGFWIIMYPEGTRTRPGEKVKYKSGGVILAQKANVDIVPVALNTGLFWQKGKGAINRGTLDIVIGEPISTQDRSVNDITAEVEAWIEANAAKITLDHPNYLALKAQEKEQKQEQQNGVEAPSDQSD